MATAREHLAAFHHEASKHHNEVAKSHTRLAECYKALHKKSGMSETDSPHCNISTEHERLSKLHQGQGDFHEQAAQGCMKAVNDELNKLVPTAVSGITPDNPHFRAVTREGQRPMPSAAEKAPVPLELEKVLEPVE